MIRKVFYGKLAQRQMNILIFKTVNEERTKRLLHHMDTQNHTVYMILPQDEVDVYSGLGLPVHCIGTNGKYIDYKSVMREGKIPDIKFHEIWVPSPSCRNLYTYWEVYAIISKLKYGKVYYKEIGEEEIITYDLKKEPLFSGRHTLLVNAVKGYITLLYWIRKNVKGRQRELYVWDCRDYQ